VTSAEFRRRHPEFADQRTYREEDVLMWLDMAAKRLRPERWADLLDHGTGLYVAHQLAATQPAQAASRRGGIAGQGGGVVQSKSVDKVSVSYDTGAITVEGGGDWNATTYGRQFLQLARLVGAGGVQL
jgi:hypothetical protein